MDKKLQEQLNKNAKKPHSNGRNGIKVGKSILSNKFKDQICPELDLHTFSILNSKQLDIQFTQIWTKILFQVESTQCQKLKIVVYLPQQDSLLKSISNIHFLELKNLSLAYCKLINIEVLEFLNMGKLQKLEICQNFITSLKPLNKSNWPHFNTLECHENLSTIIQMGRIRMKNTFNDLHMDQRGKNIQLQDPSRVLAKLQCSQLKTIQLSTHKKVIYNQRLNLLLKKRFVESNIMWHQNYTKTVVIQTHL